MTESDAAFRAACERHFRMSPEMFARGWDEGWLPRTPVAEWLAALREAVRIHESRRQFMGGQFTARDEE